MVRDGVAQTDEHGRVGYLRHKPGKRSSDSNHVTGPLRVTRRGIGFVRPEGSGEEIQIAPRFMHTALHSDIVNVVVFPRPANRRQRDPEVGGVEGEVVEIVRRTLVQVTGTFEAGRSFLYVVPDDARIGRDITIAKEDSGNARPGDKVVVKLLPWTDEDRNPEGVITDVLGKSGDARVEVLSVARSFGLPAKFPEEVQREAERLSGVTDGMDHGSRLDVRGQTCFTIDPEDAKDFDDALTIEPLRDGTLRLGVHIADVSHYVREGTALDAEAYARGTSTYLVNEVIPMLPERLSNDLCSLRPNEDRLTYSVMMDLDKDGNLDDYRITKSVIRSSRRFSYEEVQKIIDEKKGEYAEQILSLNELAHTLLKRRKKRGSIDFDTGEVKIKFDESGLPSAIVKKPRLDAHRLVEECMLLANKTVAEHIGKVRKAGDEKPFLYRIHDVPDPDRLRDLSSFLKKFGFSLDVKEGVPPKELQKLLDRVRGSEVETLINEVALRAMSKAIYSEINIGHYGLAFSHYAHFTSPIRRYPDLVVHRLLEAYGRGADRETLEKYRKAMPDIARQSTERERVATDAERASVKVMQVEFMKRHVGDTFEGVIGGVTSFGLFVEINDLLVEGLVRVRDLDDDYYIFDEKQYSLRGRSRGKVYRLGAHVRVRVVGVDPKQRDIDLAIIG